MHLLSKLLLVMVAAFTFTACQKVEEASADSATVAREAAIEYKAKTIDAANAAATATEKAAKNTADTVSEAEGESEVKDSATEIAE